TIRSVPSKIVRRQKSDTRGVVITYIPPTSGDPVQSVLDRKFYLRTIDGFVEMPYDVLKRMFAGTSAPDLRPILRSELVTRAGNVWSIPLALLNESTAASMYTNVQLEILNSSACDQVTPNGLNDQSDVNPGRTVFGMEHDKPIIRGIGQTFGSLAVTMKRNPRP